jgi:cytochrome P450
MSNVATSAIDLSDLDLFAGGAPWEEFARLRRDAPVAWNPEAAPNQGFWSVSRHRDIVAVLRDEDAFSAEMGAVNLEELGARQIRVLARLMDIPDEFGGQIIKWSNRLIGNTDPEYADVLFDSEASEECRDLPFRSPAALEVFAYGDDLARQRRGGDGTDLVSKLVNTVPQDGVPLSERDFHNYFLLLIAAGNETTRHTISHAMLALLRHPRALARLQSEPGLVPVAVEEFLRWASPVYHFRRTARRDIELRGQQVRAGDKVVVWFASGNRDEDIFGSPDDFDITRQPNDHVAFGKGGPHFCLGSSLARLELRIMFSELVGPAGHDRADQAAGIRQVQLHPRSQAAPRAGEHPLRGGRSGARPVHPARSLLPDRVGGREVRRARLCGDRVSCRSRGSVPRPWRRGQLPRSGVLRRDRADGRDLVGVRP